MTVAPPALGQGAATPYKVFWVQMSQADTEINRFAQVGYKLRSATMTQCLSDARNPKSQTVPCVMVVMEKG